MKTALITGGSAGLGKITSETLAGLGYRVVIAARDEVKGQRVVREILEKHPSADVEFAQVDMADYASVAEFAETIASRFDQVDRLILNAGLFTSSIRKNDAGHEYMFAATHMGHFL
ncbi:MAG: SDR family NAD(P)-dependent oxidoreductase, partial [Pseudomonadota bacterium]|nr:SDR family NAD(P)-dependent oxidoreductase [Pseudomonadota bacterium]